MHLSFVDDSVCLYMEEELRGLYCWPSLPLFLFFCASALHCSFFFLKLCIVDLFFFSFGNVDTPWLFPCCSCHEYEKEEKKERKEREVYGSGALTWMVREAASVLTLFFFLFFPFHFFFRFKSFGGHGNESYQRRCRSWMLPQVLCCLWPSPSFASRSCLSMPLQFFFSFLLEAFRVFFSFNEREK